MRACFVVFGLAFALILAPARINERCAHACYCPPPHLSLLEPTSLSYAATPTEETNFRAQRIRWSLSGDNVYPESNGYSETYVRVR